MNRSREALLGRLIFLVLLTLLAIAGISILAGCAPSPATGREQSPALADTRTPTDWVGTGPSRDWARAAGQAENPVAPPDWVAEGYCQPAPVAGDTLVHAFAPYATGEMEGASQIVVEASPERLRLGDYLVTFDSGAKRIEVSGPAGADILERDIRRCVYPEGLTPASNIGTWAWSAAENAWRYQDSSLAEMGEQLGINAQLDGQ